MAMEEALVARLTGAGAISAIVGDSISWFGRQRGDGLPALVLNKVSPGREWTHDGPDELDRPRVQFDSYAAEAGQAAALGRAIRAEMETTADVGGVRFHPAQLDGEFWNDEGEQDGGEALFRVSQDYVFFFEEI